MIRITRQADYGIVLLTQFIEGVGGNVPAADVGTRILTARDLSEASRLPLPMVGKILKILVRKGLLASHRGVKGGYSLALPAEKITVADMVSALDGPIAMTTCAAHAGDCEIENKCPAQSNWHRINLAVLKALKGITLKDMTSTTPTPRISVEPPPAPAGGVVANAARLETR